MTLINDIVPKAAFIISSPVFISPGGFWREEPSAVGSTECLAGMQGSRRLEMPSPSLLPKDAKFCGAESSECQGQEADAAQLLCLPGEGFGCMWDLQENIICVSTGWEELGENKGRSSGQMCCALLRRESPN